MDQKANPNVIKDVYFQLEKLEPNSITMPGKAIPISVLQSISTELELAYNQVQQKSLNKLIIGTYSLENMADLFADLLKLSYMAIKATVILNFPFYAGWQELVVSYYGNFKPNIWNILYKQWTAFTLQNDPSIIVEKGGKYDIEDYMKDAEWKN